MKLCTKKIKYFYTSAIIIILSIVVIFIASKANLSDEELLISLTLSYSILFVGLSYLGIFSYCLIFNTLLDKYDTSKFINQKGKENLIKFLHTSLYRKFLFLFGLIILIFGGITGTIEYFSNWYRYGKSITIFIMGIGGAIMIYAVKKVIDKK